MVLGLLADDSLGPTAGTPIDRLTAAGMSKDCQIGDICEGMRLGIVAGLIEPRRGEMTFLLLTEAGLAAIHQLSCYVEIRHPAAPSTNLHGTPFKSR